MSPRSSAGSAGVARLVAAGVALSGAVVLYAFDPATTGIYPRCPFLLTTGCYCPGCGALRAMHQLLRGNLLAAAGYNALLVAAIPAIVAMLLVPRWSYSPRVTRVALVLVVAFGVARNIPAWPFVLLRP